MSLARRLVELGRAARADAKVRTRQPLRRALVAVGGVGPARRRAARRGRRGAQRRLARAAVLGRRDLVDHAAKGNFRALGKRFGKQTPRGRGRDRRGRRRRRWPPRCEADGRGRRSTVDGEDVEVLPDEVIVSERPREGWSVVNEQGETVALDLELTPELVRAGLAREVVRLVQEARKTSGFEVTDRIALRWQADGELAEALREHAGAGRRRGARHRGPRGRRRTGDVRRDDDLGLAFTRDRAV